MDVFGLLILYVAGSFGLFHEKRMYVFDENDGRPILPKEGSDSPNESNPVRIPEGFLPALTTYDASSRSFTNGNLTIFLPDNRYINDSPHSFQYFDESCNGHQFYFFLSIQELADAGINTTKSIGFNYWNPESLAWEFRGYVLENSWTEPHIYIVPNNSYPVCYELNVQDGKLHSGNSKLPIFELGQFESAWCFNPFFSESGNVTDAYFFVEFRRSELEKLGLNVPADPTGYQFDPLKVSFTKIEKPGDNYDWDPNCKQWAPICTAMDESNQPCDCIKLVFDWEKQKDLLDLPVCSFRTRNLAEADEKSKQNHKYIESMFAIDEGPGPYCVCNCYCGNCGEFYDPSDASLHAFSETGWYQCSKQILERW